MALTYDVYGCFECGQAFMYNENDTTNHLTEDFESIDYDADDDHVAYGMWGVYQDNEY